MNLKNHILIAAILFGGLLKSSAHLSVSGDRTLGVVDNTTATNTTRTVSSSFGWADATDSDWGNSHRLTAFKFTLNSTQSVTITAARRDAIGQTGGNGTLLPAFSLYSLIGGNFVTSTHDESAGGINYLTGLFGSNATAESFTDTNSSGFWDTGEPFTDTNSNGVWDSAGIGGSGKEGAFRALDNWKIYQDNGDPNTALLNDFTYIGNAADGTSANYGSASRINGDGNADGTVSATFSLAAGDYYFLVGGADYLAQNTDQLTNNGTAQTYKSYGIGVTVTAVPEPSVCALVALGAGGIVLWNRSRIRRN